LKFSAVLHLTAIWDWYESELSTQLCDRANKISLLVVIACKSHH